MIQDIIEWFNKPTTNKFKFFGWLLIAAVYVTLILMLLSVGGCKSFEKTTKYKPNTDWRINKL